MDSTALPQGFSDWADFNDLTVKRAPATKGVYVLRLKGGRDFGRLKGRSDIVYIGKTEAGIRGRLRQYLNPGPTQITNQRVNQLMKRHDLEVAWKEDQNPNTTEHNLLLQYVKDHDELPPLNRQYPEKVVVELSEKLRVANGTASKVKRS